MITTGDIKTELLVELGTSTTVAYYTDTILDSWINKAHRWAASVHNWPQTEGRVSTTYVATEEWSFEGYKPDSFRLMTVGGYGLTKVNFGDYIKYREQIPNSTTPSGRIWSDYGRIVFINPTLDVSGTLTAYGHYIPATLDATDPTTNTIFSNDEEGNTAIVEEVLSYAAIREGNVKDSQVHHANAKIILDGIWKVIQDEQYAYQTKNRDMFNRIDVLNGYIRPDVNSVNQFFT